MGKGKRKIEIKEIEEKSRKQVTFSKRRKGLFNKAAEFAAMTGTEVAILAFSPAGKPFIYGVPALLQDVDPPHPHSIPSLTDPGAGEEAAKKTHHEAKKTTHDDNFFDALEEVEPLPPLDDHRQCPTTAWSILPEDRNELYQLLPPIPHPDSPSKDDSFAQLLHHQDCYSFGPSLEADHIFGALQLQDSWFLDEPKADFNASGEFFPYL